MASEKCKWWKVSKFVIGYLVVQIYHDNSNSLLTRTKSYFPWISTHFSVIFTRLTRTRISRIPRYTTRTKVLVLRGPNWPILAQQWRWCELRKYKFKLRYDRRSGNCNLTNCKLIPPAPNPLPPPPKKKNPKSIAALTQRPWVRIPLKFRIFFQINLQLLKLQLPLRRSYLHAQFEVVVSEKNCTFFGAAKGQQQLINRSRIKCARNLFNLN